MKYVKKISVALALTAFFIFPTIAKADIFPVMHWSDSYYDQLYVFQENVTLAEGALDYLRVDGDAYYNGIRYNRSYCRGVYDAWVEHPPRLKSKGTKYSTNGKHTFTEDGITKISSTSDSVTVPYTTSLSTSTSSESGSNIARKDDMTEQEQLDYLKEKSKTVTNKTVELTGIQE